MHSPIAEMDSCFDLWLYLFEERHEKGFEEHYVVKKERRSVSLLTLSSPGYRGCI